MDWINEYWSAAEAANAKEWMLEAVTWHLLLLLFTDQVHDSQMTAFATARRHKFEASQVSTHSVTRQFTRTASDPRLRPTATDKLHSGMQNLASLQSTVRQKVALPRFPGDVSSSRPASPAVPSASPSPCPLSTSVDISTATFTLAEEAEIERDKVKLDRLAAEKEWAEYMAAGVVALSDKPGSAGLNLVHFWDVSHLFCLIAFNIVTEGFDLGQRAITSTHVSCCSRCFACTGLSCSLRAAVLFKQGNMH